MAEIFTALISFAAVTLVSQSAIETADRHIKVSDVVQQQSVDPTLWNAVKDKIIADIPKNKTETVLKRAAIANLTARRVPALKNIAADESNGTIKITFADRKSSQAKTCFLFSRPVAAGTIIRSEDLMPANCDERSSVEGLKYDRGSGFVRAKSNRPVGSYAGRITVPKSRFADIGDPLTLSVFVGNVQIERTVWAMQPANRAERIFVKDRDGNLLNVAVSKTLQGSVVK